MSEIGRDLIAQIRKVAEEHPNTIIPDGACQYVYGEASPVCLVGHALVALDRIPANDPDKGCNEFQGWNVEKFEDTYLTFGLGDLDPIEVDWIQEAQSAQDDQKTWAESVEIADRYCGEGLTRLYADSEMAS